MFPFKNVDIFNDLENKLNLDENGLVQLVCIQMINTIYYKMNKLFKEFWFFVVIFPETFTTKKLVAQVLKTMLKEYWKICL